MKKAPICFRSHALSAAVVTALAVTAPMTALAKTVQGGDAGGQFWHTATFDVIEGNGSGVAEIVDVTVNGKQLVYTDADNESIGFVDISDPFNPVGQGTVALEGEPTSLVILDPLILVGVNTSESFTDPSGQLVVVHRNSREIVAVHELGGQPDSLALAPDRKRAAIVIENERDEDLNDGLLPQYPSGTLLIVDLRGAAKKWEITEANLDPVRANAENGDDLEPEFVDINEHNEAVVSFQENNHLAVVDLVTGETVSEFSAGEVELEKVDATEDDLIMFAEMLTKRREPDAVTWIDHDSFATANEGDYEDEDGEGGSRGFTVFNRDGTVEWESYESFEHWIASVGQYNEGRSENKGCEPEAVDSGNFGGRTLLFVGSERCNVVGVYDVSSGTPEPMQLLPTGIRPEGLKAMPKRNLFAASTESDEADAGIPTMINLYRAEDAPALYPMIASADDANGTPIPWVALSGLVGDPADADTLYAVSDSFLASGFIYTIDVSVSPAEIVDRLEVSGASADLDLEGVAIGPDGHFWLGSEGNTGSRPNLVLKVDGSGHVVEEIELPADLVDERRGNGIEGIAVTGEAGSEVVYVAIQRAWPNEGDTDQVNTKIGRYEVATGEWGFVHYPLEPEGNGDWIGLSELTLLPDGSFAVIERDKGWGPSTGFNAELKAVFGVELETANFLPYQQGVENGGLVGIDKWPLYDLLPTMEAISVWTAEKLEGLAVAADGDIYAVTDNDGVDEATGETLFFQVGTWNGESGE
jgi:hypothetical protein